MKTLFIIRHAKSSWSFDLKDFDRPLGERGRKDVKIMGKHLSQKFERPDLMIASPASRAFHTALFLGDHWVYPEEHLLLEPQFYHGSTSSFTRVLSNLGDYDTVAIFGHNPGLTELSNELCDTYIDNIATCGVVRIQFDMSKWKKIVSIKGELMDYIKPKDLK